MSPDPSTSTEMKRSEPISIKAKIEVNCEASKSTAFRWEIFSISRHPVNYQPFAREPSKPVLVSNQAELYVREIGLDFGFYKCVFTVSMEGVEGVSGTAVGYIHVVATQSQDSLQAFVDGGPRKRYKFGRNVSCISYKYKLQFYDKTLLAKPAADKTVAPGSDC